MAGDNLRPPNPSKFPIPSIAGVICRKDDRPDNLFQIVANRKPIKTPESPPSQNLIDLTEKLAEEAKRGTLKGLGGFAEYVDGYIFGLEGSYLEKPESAVLPLERLKRRIMDQIEKEE